MKQEKLMFFFRNLDQHNKRLNRKMIVFFQEQRWNLPYLEVNGI